MPPLRLQATQNRGCRPRGRLPTRGYGEAQPEWSAIVKDETRCRLGERNRRNEAPGERVERKGGSDHLAGWIGAVRAGSRYAEALSLDPVNYLT